MEIGSVDLLPQCQGCQNRDIIKQALIGYINHRVGKAIEDAWDKSAEVLRATNLCRQKRIRNSILNYNENGQISVREFTKYFIGVVDELRQFAHHGTPEHRKAAIDVVSTMYTLLGDVKIDKRTLFTKDVDETETEFKKHIIEIVKL